MKTRLKYIILFILIFLTEVYIALYVHDDLVRPYIGDMLVVVLIYFFIKAVLPRKNMLLPVYIFLFAVCVELLQLFNLPEILNIQNRAVKIILGSTFDIRDIACYLAGCLLLYIPEMLIHRKSNSVQ